MNRLYPIFIILVLLSLSFSAHAIAEQENPDRFKTIDQKLDCLERASEQGIPISWSDICYAAPRDVDYSERQKSINQALDFAESYTVPKKPTRRQQYQRKNVSAFPQNYERNLNYQKAFNERARQIKEDDVKPSMSVEEYKKSSSHQYYEKRNKEEAEKKERTKNTELGISVGYRQDELNWSVQGANGTPNTELEFIFKDIEIIETELSGKILPQAEEGVVLEGDFAYGYVVDGRHQDSFYLADDRQSLDARTDNSAKDGYTMDGSTAIGYRIPIKDKNKYFDYDKAYVTPLFGYSYHEQNLDISDGFQTVDNSGFFPLGPFSGLDSSYDTEWDGYWTGFELKGLFNHMAALFRFEYHWADYQAFGNLNLNSFVNHPKSFKHTSKGRGLVYELGLDYDHSEDWNFQVLANYQDWETDAGTEKLFFNNGTELQSTLNPADWKSFGLTFGATYSFENLFPSPYTEEMLKKTN